MGGMAMYFHWGVDETFLFKGWVPSNYIQYFLTLFALLAMVLAKEYLFSLRKEYEIKQMKDLEKKSEGISVQLLTEDERRKQ